MNNTKYTAVQWLKCNLDEVKTFLYSVDKAYKILPIYVNGGVSGLLAIVHNVPIRIFPYEYILYDGSDRLLTCNPNKFKKDYVETSVPVRYWPELCHK